MSEDATRDAWRDAFAEFDRLAGLDALTREQELARLAKNNPDARARLHALFAADDQAAAASFLSGNAVIDAMDAEGPPRWSLESGATLGAYRLERPLGQGGMGEVWLAHRADGHFEGRVAVKFLHPHLASSSVRERFAREGQILARLAHPRIARLLDAGVSESGRLYFVIEHVDGDRLDHWCDRRRLDVRSRLALFLQICDAVSHAHAHLVLHRDLKPSNILVDGEGRIKLLDFGVAKLVGTDAEQTSVSELTGSGRAFTPEYASPEQVTGAPATVATDVYGLGLVLHRLMTGARPYGATAQRPADLERAILEEEAARSSAAIAEDDFEKASARSCTPRQLRRALRGDIDVIVASCLRKPPAERYATVPALADDVRRHLEGRPLVARPERWPSRMAKFVRRHKVGASAAAAVLLAIAGGVAGIVWQAREAALERDLAQREAARAEAVRDYVMLMFRTARDEAGDTPLTAKQVLDLSAARLQNEYSGDPALQTRLLLTLARLHAELDDYEGAAPLLDRLVNTSSGNVDPVVLAESRHVLANIAFRQGNVARARSLLDQAQEFWQREPGRFRGQLLESRLVQAQIERESGQVGRSIQTLRAALDERITYSGSTHSDTISAMNSLAAALAADNQLDEAARVIDDAWDGVRALGRERSGWALVILNNRAGIAARRKDFDRAEALFREAIGLRKELYGPSTALAVMQLNLGSILTATGRASEAAEMLRGTVDMAAQYSGADSPVTVNSLLKLARARVETGDMSGGEETVLRALDNGRRKFGDRHLFVAEGEAILARIRRAQGRTIEARSLADRAAATLRTLGPAAASLLAEVDALLSQLSGSPR